MKQLFYTVAFFCFLPPSLLNAFSFDEKENSSIYTIAVSDFAVLGKDPTKLWMGESCAEGIITKLSLENSLRIVERKYLNKILDELKFAESGLVDENSAAQLGKLLGARYVIFGSISEANQKIVLRARVVNVETGSIFSSVEAQGALDDIFSLQTDLSRKIAIKFLGGTSIIPETNSNEFLSVSYAIQSKLSRLKLLASPLPLFALDPARKRKLGEYNSALTFADDLIDKFPNSFQGYYYKALFAMHSENWEEADQFSKIAKEVAPSNIEVLLIRSLYFYNSKKYQEAKSILKYLSSQYPNDGRVWYGLAKVYSYEDNNSLTIESLINSMGCSSYPIQAETMLQTLVNHAFLNESSFSSKEYYYAAKLFQCIWENGSKITPEYLRYAGNVNKAFPKLFISYYILGLSNFENGNYETAKSNINTCLTLAPSFADVQRQIALIYYKTGDCRNAKQHALLYMKTAVVVENSQSIQQIIDQCR